MVVAAIVTRHTQPRVVGVAADMVMKSRAHAGSKKVAAFCTLLGCTPAPVRRCGRDRWGSTGRRRRRPANWGLCRAPYLGADARPHEELGQLQRREVGPCGVHESAVGSDTDTRSPLVLYARDDRGARGCTACVPPGLPVRTRRQRGWLAACDQRNEVLADSDDVGCH